MLAVTLLIALGADPSAAPNPADQKDPIICRRSTEDTGTHMRPKPRCLPKSQWDYLERQAQRDVRDPQSRLVEPSRAGGRPPGG